MMTAAQRQKMAAVVALLFVLIAFLQYRIDPLRRQPAIEPPRGKEIFNPHSFGGGAGLPFEYMLGALTGFRQVVAGLLWVRADSFFHSGNYDAILPLVRIITWLDPNFIDVYSTGAWHLMYNFTDEAQRSDRRYLPAGMALLNEGIENNKNMFDLYADAAWNNFDKIKNFDEAARYYEMGLKTKNVDYTRVGHGLAHSLEKAGRVDDAIAQWEANIEAHQRVLNDPNESADRKNRARQGIQTAQRNLNIMRIRRIRREDDVKPPIDVQFDYKVVRVKPEVLEVSGQVNIWGAKNFDENIWGPADGTRVEVRLQDAGYQMPTPKEFKLEIDQDVTIMQDSLSTRGGKLVKPGSLYIVSTAAAAPTEAERLGIYAFEAKDAPQGVGVPLRQALAGGATLSAEGRQQIQALAGMSVEALRGNAETLNKLTSAGYYVGTKNYLSLGKFRREIDMSKDPKMYSFKKDKYDLILTINPRTAPEFVQDRIGWNGEGLTDKRYLDTKTKPGLRQIRAQIELKREDIVGPGRKVLAD